MEVQERKCMNSEEKKTNLPEQTDDIPAEGQESTGSKVHNSTSPQIPVPPMLANDPEPEKPEPSPLPDTKLLSQEKEDVHAEETSKKIEIHIPQAAGQWKEKSMRFLTSWKVSAGAIALAILLAMTSLGLGSSAGGKDRTIRELKNQITELEDQNSEKDSTISSLEEKIDELENGPDRLLEKVQAKSNDKDWNGTVEAADVLHEEYPGTQADAKGQELKKAAQDEIAKAEEAKRKEEERKKQEEEKKKQEEAAKKAEEERIKAEKEAQGYETGITYDQLARYPDEYIGEKVKFNGKVLQVMNDGDSYTIRLAVDSIYDTVIMGYFAKSAMTKGKILEDDIITIYGTSGGDYSYKAVMGNEITVPLVLIDKIDQ